MLKSIEEEWLGFAAMVIPTLTKQHVQYQEMKKAFYAGAWAIQAAIAEIGEPHISEEEGCAHLDRLAAECREFQSQMMRKYGERN